MANDHMDEMKISEICGANMDVDLVSDNVGWEQSAFPWSEAEQIKEQKCAVKDISVCKYFCGIRYLDTIQWMRWSEMYLNMLRCSITENVCIYTLAI